jgi:biuret amidohydrolase
VPTHPTRETRTMSWKTAHRSFYYANAPEPDDPVLPPRETALLCIDVQNYGLALADEPSERVRWEPFHARMRGTVIPTLRAGKRGINLAIQIDEFTKR